MPLEKQCPVRACKAVHTLALLMCPMHWRLVPHHLKENVWRHYQRGQELFAHGFEVPAPTPAYLDAASAAIAAVEARIVPGSTGLLFPED